MSNNGVSITTHDELFAISPIFLEGVSPEVAGRRQ